MMYPLMTLNDGTEIVHSELLPDNSVKVVIETPIRGGFKNMTVYLPSYEIESVNGYSQREVNKFMKFIRSAAHLIIRFAKGGGFEHAPVI